ncbi:hypothetical protein [Streptomyces bugieae]|uniref:HNH endonuclease n=1 Tax=Streptomyces bugieae TaxID=3098223 RepID=A0ABU7NL38_9ACTN|nr:hypothetical protein [Streptomyces sp. DSM 41528]
MTVFAQPASLKTPSVRRHYEDTILKPVTFEEHADLLSAELRTELHKLFPEGAAQLWGVTPGLNGANLPQIRKMQAGDTVFFAGNKRLYLVGTMATTWHNPDLARRLWGIDERTQQTWEHMYALTDVRGLNFPMGEVRSLLNWVPNRNIQGFVALRDDDGLALTDHVTFTPNTPATTPNVTPGNAKVPKQRPAGPSDGETTTQSRREQARLKNHLIPGATGDCALCGRTFPRAFLIAAHIKKRAACTEDERWDLNIGMLACLLGCDSLYEHGLIAVDEDGALQISPAAQDAPFVSKHINEHLKGRTTTWWNPEREKYYAWHRAHTFQTGALLPEQVNK